MDIKKAADLLYDAEKEIKAIDMLTLTWPEMTVDDAYQVQLANIKRKVADGETIVGAKIGLTSKGMQALIGVHEPDFGFLTDKMWILEGQDVRRDTLIAPKIEGELAFCLKKALKGPGITVVHVYDACDYVVPALELVDSRIRDWKVKLQDTIADNGSSSGFILGGAMTPIANVDMRLTGMNFEKNGVHISSATTAEVMGNPAAAIAWLANKLGSYGLELPAGSVVLAGALTAAVPVEAGDTVTASFTGMGSVSVKFV